MDPNENLARQLKLAQAIIATADGDELAPGLRDISDEDRAEELAQLVLALAQWRSMGGFAPDAPPVPTPNGFDPRWVAAINQALQDRDSIARITDLNDGVWARYIGPLIDALDDPNAELRRQPAPSISAANVVDDPAATDTARSLDDLAARIGHDVLRWGDLEDEHGQPTALGLARGEQFVDALRHTLPASVEMIADSLERDAKES